MDNVGSKQKSWSLSLETKRARRRWLYTHGQALVGRAVMFAATPEIGRVNCEARPAPEMARGGAGSLLAARFGSSRFQNRSCSGEDTSRALIGNFLFRFQPVLYVATAELRAFEAQRFTADERDRLGRDLADMSSGLFAIHESFGCCVS